MERGGGGGGGGGVATPSFVQNTFFPTAKNFSLHTAARIGRAGQNVHV